MDKYMDFQLDSSCRPETAFRPSRYSPSTSCRARKTFASWGRTKPSSHWAEESLAPPSGSS